MELVDTGDLKSPDFGRAGSSPALATIYIRYGTAFNNKIDLFDL